MKHVKHIVAECTERDIVIIRDHGTELRTSNIAPYKKALAPYWEKTVKDYWREGDAIIIVL